ncbi:short-chain dehydrogenase [Arthrobacter sp. YN]|nr:short-chain dehydrogenase [Arthrobacter sp. YN]
MLTGRTAFVTGAGRNIGRAIAIRCGSEGASVAVNDVDATAAAAVVAELRDAGVQAHAAIGDMSDFAVVDRVFAETEEALGTVDILVNNAYVRCGDTAWGNFLAVSPADWELFVAKNMNMLYGCTQRTARALARSNLKGSIVNISSHGAERAHRNHIPYDSVKGAMESFTRAVAVDLAPWGIRVNALRPGAIAVEGEPPMWDDKEELRAAQIPLGRAGSPEDIAAGVVFLASAESAFITGQTFNIDGGMMAQGRAPQVEGVPVMHPGNAELPPTSLFH